MSEQDASAVSDYVEVTSWATITWHAGLARYIVDGEVLQREQAAWRMSRVLPYVAVCEMLDDLQSGLVAGFTWDELGPVDDGVKRADPELVALLDAEQDYHRSSYGDPVPGSFITPEQVMSELAELLQASDSALQAAALRWDEVGQEEETTAGRCMYRALADAAREIARAKHCATIR